MTSSYTENPKDSTKKLLESSEVTEYEINIQKSIVFLYTKNKLFEKEWKTINLFIIASKTVKHLGTNLTKEVNEMYLES